MTMTMMTIHHVHLLLLLFSDGRRDGCAVVSSDFCDDDRDICHQGPHHHLSHLNDGCCIDHGIVLVEAFESKKKSTKTLRQNIQRMDASFSINFDALLRKKGVSWHGWDWVCVCVCDYGPVQVFTKDSK